MERALRMKKKIGTVTMEEKDTIQGLYERKNALSELFKSLKTEGTANIDYLYEKLVNDMTKTDRDFKKWWTGMRDKYDWEDVAGMRWSINFDTCEIFLESDDHS